MKQASAPGDHLVLAGDIFDLMVGSSSFYADKYSSYFNQLNACIRSGVTVHYIEGNHDFHLRKLFPAQVDFQEEAIILTDAYNNQRKKQLYIAHGDLVDREDESYLRLRKLLRSRFIKNLAEWIPGALTEKIGLTFSRSTEQKALDGAHPGVREKFRNFARKKYEEGYDFVVLGHCHDFDAVEPYYYNMGYPPLHQQWLHYDSASGLQRRPFANP